MHISFTRTVDRLCTSVSPKVDVDRLCTSVSPKDVDRSYESQFRLKQMWTDPKNRSPLMQAQANSMHLSFTQSRWRQTLYISVSFKDFDELYASHKTRGMGYRTSKEGIEQVVTPCRTVIILNKIRQGTRVKTIWFHGQANQSPKGN